MYEPPVVGVGDLYRAAATLGFLVGMDWSDVTDEAPSFAAVTVRVCSLGVVWIAGFYASFAISLRRIRRGEMLPAARDSPVPRPVRNG